MRVVWTTDEKASSVEWFFLWVNIDVNVLMWAMTSLLEHFMTTRVRALGQ